jgi:hypothetical protein
MSRENSFLFLAPTETIGSQPMLASHAQIRVQPVWKLVAGDQVRTATVFDLS